MLYCIRNGRKKRALRSCTTKQSSPRLGLVIVLLTTNTGNAGDTCRDKTKQNSEELLATYQVTSLTYCKSLRNVTLGDSDDQELV